MMDAWVLAVFIGYFAVLIGIAVFRARRMRAMSDYVLGGRQLSSFTTALSASSSTTSAWTILALPALAFAGGVTHLWTVVALVAGSWICWTVVAKRLRRYTVAADDALTLPEFLEKRFGDTSHVLRTLAALLTILFVIFYISSGLVAGAKLLESEFGVEYTPGILITLIAVASYTFIGGFLAVSRTDVFQSVLMLVGFMIVPLTLIVVAGDSLLRAGSDTPGFWNPLTDPDNNPITPVMLLSAVGWGLGFFGSQRILQRFMAIEGESSIPAGRSIGTIWIALMYTTAVVLGVIALPALTEMDLLEAVADPERIYLVVAVAFFHPVITGLLMTTLIAAVMSTADSQLLLASAVAADDVPVIRRLTYSRAAYARVWIGRGLLVVIGIVAAVLALVAQESVLQLVTYAWGGMGAAFGPVTILALYWRRFNLWGAGAAIVTGTLVSSIWWVSSGGPGGVMDIHPATPGFVAGLLTAVAVALLTPPPKAATVRTFDQVIGQREAAA